jgi:peroxiredoxin
VPNITIPRRGLAALAAAGLAAALLATSASATEPGKPAPAFSGVDSNGKPVALADLRGKTVVMEWTNDGCPYVAARYNSGAMQALQKEATSQGVVWLSVISSKPGAQGYADGARANGLTKSRGAAPSHVVLDPKGVIGRAYDARTTPQMVVIDGQGVIRYQGAIDDRVSTSPSDAKAAKNYVRAALTDMKAGKPVQTALTKSFGCDVKY